MNFASTRSDGSRTVCTVVCDRALPPILLGQVACCSEHKQANEPGLEPSDSVGSASGCRLFRLPHDMVERGHLHWPMTTLSPSVTRKQGDTWAAMLPCRFSYLHPRWPAELKQGGERALGVAHQQPSFLARQSRTPTFAAFPDWSARNGRGHTVHALN